MLQKILACLADGEFHSGQQLAEVLNVSRGSVWNHLQNLSSYGLSVYSVRGKGYRLEQAIELLDAAYLNHHLPAYTLLPVTQSTNDWVLHHIKSLSQGHVCVAEFQTAGRGRNERVWQAPYGANIIYSKLWNFEEWQSDLGGLSLVVGLAVVQSLRQLGVQGVKLKWPNDMVVVVPSGLAKLGGILVDIRAEAAGGCQVVIGIGVNTHAAPDDVGQTVTHCNELINSHCGRNELLVAMDAGLTGALQDFANKGFAYFLPLWEAHDVLLGQQVRLQVGDERITGVAQGVSETGALQIYHDGALSKYAAGEVNVRLRS